MKIKNIYIGTWFQRTTLHMKEINNFLKYGQGIKRLDEKRLKSLWSNLNLKDIQFHEEGEFDYIQASDNGSIVTITEDGVILLKHPDSKIEKAIKDFDDLYTNRLGKAINYLFSLGAPLSKILTNIEDIFPVIIVSQNLSNIDTTNLFKESNDEVISFVSGHNVEFYSGNRISVLNLIGKIDIPNLDIEEILRHIIFFREFELQLSSYLNMHRDIWDEIALIRESRTLRYRDFPKVREQILDFLKTISFVKARLGQMEDNILSRRELVEDGVLKLLKDLGLNRFEHLEANQKYIVELWKMTEEYVDGTLSLLESLFQENTQIELSAIKFITLIGAVTSFFGMNIAFPWEERWPDIFWSSIYVVIFILIIGILFYIFLSRFIYARRFKVNVLTQEIGYKDRK